MIIKAIMIQCIARTTDPKTMMIREVSLCKNCHQSVVNKYCSFCGQKTSTARFSSGQLLHDLIHGVFHIDRGLVFTTRELLRRPGTTMKNYLHGQRVSYFNPFTFCIIIGGINSFLLQKIHWSGLFLDLGLISKYDIHHETWNMSLKYFAYRMLVSVPVVSLISFLFYYRRHFNFIEHIIINTYMCAAFCLLMICLLPFEFLIHSPVIIVGIRLLFVIAGLIYIGWSFAQVFENTPLKTILIAKGIFVSFVGIAVEIILVGEVAKHF